jgi:putative transcriptional regulator
MVMRKYEEKYLLRNNLKNIRKNLEITQEELACQIGVQKSYYSRLERGEFVPSIKICLMIHQAIVYLYFEKTGKHLEKLTVDRLFYLDCVED